MKNEFMVGVDQIKSIYGRSDANLNLSLPRVSQSWMSNVGFWIKYVYLD